MSRFCRLVDTAARFALMSCRIPSFPFFHHSHMEMIDNRTAKDRRRGCQDPATMATIVVQNSIGAEVDIIGPITAFRLFETFRQYASKVEHAKSFCIHVAGWSTRRDYLILQAVSK
jgi:hypothetical protein